MYNPNTNLINMKLQCSSNRISWMPLSIAMVLPQGSFCFPRIRCKLRPLYIHLKAQHLTPTDWSQRRRCNCPVRTPIGATAGANSLKVSIVPGATFVGALTGNLDPAFGNPPGVDHILFDLTIAPGEEFTGGFGIIGVTIFGASQPDYPGGQQFGLQAQFLTSNTLRAKQREPTTTSKLTLIRPRPHYVRHQPVV